MRRGVWFALAVLAIVVLAGDTAYWAFVSRQLEMGFRNWLAAQSAAGWTLTGTPPRLSGWPLAARMTVTHVTLSGGALDFPGGVRWTADRLALQVDLLHPGHLQAIPGGMQHLRLGDGPVVPYTATAMQADVPLQPNQPPHQVLLHATGLRIGVVPGGDASSTLAIAHLQASLDSQPPRQDRPALGFTIDAASLDLPSRFRWALGPQVAALRLDGMLTGPFPLARDIAARAAAWRDHGGALRLQRLALRWGPMDLSGDAKLALDQQLQPNGQASVRIVGYDSTLDALAKGGAISPSAALAAKAVLSLMARPATGGQPAGVDVPLRIQGGTVFMHQVPLLLMPELDWPAS